MTLIQLVIYSAIVLIVVGFFIYKCFTDDLSEDDPTVRDFLDSFSRFSDKKKQMIIEAERQGVFDDDDDS